MIARIHKARLACSSQTQLPVTDLVSERIRGFEGLTFGLRSHPSHYNLNIAAGVAVGAGVGVADTYTAYEYAESNNDGPQEVVYQQYNEPEWTDDEYNRVDQDDDDRYGRDDDQNDNSYSRYNDQAQGMEEPTQSWQTSRVLAERPITTRVIVAAVAEAVAASATVTTADASVEAAV